MFFSLRLFRKWLQFTEWMECLHVGNACICAKQRNILSLLWYYQIITCYKIRSRLPFLSDTVVWCWCWCCFYMKTNNNNNNNGKNRNFPCCMAQQYSINRSKRSDECSNNVFYLSIYFIIV